MEIQINSDFDHVKMVDTVKNTLKEKVKTSYSVVEGNE